MKAFILLSTILIAVSAATFEISEYRIESQFSLKSEKNSPYDTCIELLEKVLAEAAEISIYIINKEWAKALPLLVRLSKHLYDDVECFLHPKENGSELSDPFQCVKEHLIKAQDAAKALIEALQRLDFNEVSKQANIIIQELLTITDCFR